VDDIFSFFESIIGPSGGVSEIKVIFSSTPSSVFLYLKKSGLKYCSVRYSLKDQDFCHDILTALMNAFDLYFKWKC